MEDKQLNRYYGCLTFVAKQRSHDLCGSNGLPLTPNSIKILGRAQFLKTLEHPNLFTYIDVLRGKHERTVIVTEQYGTPLSEFTFENNIEILGLVKDVLKALAYLHSKDITHRSLSKKNIFFCNSQWKVFNYGLYYMTGNGMDVLFPIGDIKYFAPDVILQGPHEKTSGKADIWSLGIILAEILLDCDIFSNESLSSCIKDCLSFIGINDVFYAIAKKCNKCDILKKLPYDIILLVNKMLKTNPLDRPSARQLLKEDIFALLSFEKINYQKNQSSAYLPLDRNSLLELYHYWRLAGGDVYQELKKEGLIRTKPAILSIPNLLLLEGTSFGQTVNDARIFEEQLIFLTINHLIERFRKLPKIYRYPDLNNSFIMSKETSEMASLPLAIKERDIDYQFKRIQLFNKVLKFLPSEHSKLLRESRQDIPPFLRAIIWSMILEIDDDYSHQYICIDKESPMPTDRQIEVDIPRCHQYNELLSSSAGHIKFKRILKAWVKRHPEYVYWQGLDSLCAPFLYLNFNDEARAYSCLKKFIDKYLHNFFLRDNSAVIKEYLAKFKHLIAFLDPLLATHLLKIGFSPELFAIPWFLTMFSHVFPIQKILNLWDSLLLGSASYPLFIGYSILQQLRSVLLESGFNECILLFSDLPEIDIEKCVKDSMLYYESTPRSVTYRQNEVVDKNEKALFDGLDPPAVTIDIITNECCPRISNAELKVMIQNPILKTKLLIVDIRYPTLYNESNIPGSLNIHTLDLKLEKHIDNSLMHKSELSVLYNNKGKIITVVGDNDKKTSEFCSFLLKSGFPKVCSLNGGFRGLYMNGRPF